MRLRKAELRRRVNGDMELRFESQGLTSYAGLELLRSHFGRIGLARCIGRHLGRIAPASDFGVVPMLTLVLMLLISGGRRVRHLSYLESDPMILRSCGLARLPTARSVGRWLGGFGAAQLEALSQLNDEVVRAGIERAGLCRLTLDVDGSVVSTGLKVEGAQRGYNPHRRKVPSYYPISAYEAQSGQVVRIVNRPGNVHDGKASLEFLEALLSQLRTDAADRERLLEFRMDGAFFRKDVLDLLNMAQAEYAIKVPFYRWLGLKQLIRIRRRWQPVDAGVSYFDKQLRVSAWDRRLRVVVYRKRVHHATRKNFQLDLFDPDDGYYEYSAIVTNKALSGRYLWHFMCGRGTHEKVYGELKNGFAFNCLPTQRYGANSPWQALSVLAFNLMRGFQVATTARRRSANRKRRALYRFRSIHTIRYQCLHRAGLLIRPNGRSILEVGTAPAVRKHFSRIHRQLQNAA